MRYLYAIIGSGKVLNHVPMSLFAAETIRSNIDVVISTSNLHGEATDDSRDKRIVYTENG